MKARLASGNLHKLRELRAALPDWDLELVAADAYPDEVGSTYYANALAKARFGRSLAEPDAWVVGEDSGIEVEALGGGPGVQSARFAEGRHVERLLDALRGVDGDGRRARYVCELVALAPGGAERRGTGAVEGRISAAPRGTQGFGYDPIFVPAGEERTVAELGDGWKALNSHRARAAAALREAVGAA